jgi:hypothetical protein
VSLEMRFDAVCLKLCLAVVRHGSMLEHMSCLIVRVSKEEFSVGVRLFMYYTCPVVGRVMLLTVHTNDSFAT